MIVQWFGPMPYRSVVTVSELWNKYRTPIRLHYRSAARGLTVQAAGTALQPAASAITPFITTGGDGTGPAVHRSAGPAMTTEKVTITYDYRQPANRGGHDARHKTFGRNR